MSTTKQSAGLFPKAVLASIGAAAATLEWTRTFLARAIERGEMAEMEAREAIQHPEPGQPANAPATGPSREIGTAAGSRSACPWRTRLWLTRP